MKGAVALLIVALCQYAHGMRVSSCIEEIKHAPDLNGQGCFSSGIATGAEYLLRASVPDKDLQDAKFVCAKVQFDKVDNSKRLMKFLTHHEKFSITMVKELTKVEKKGVLGKDSEMPGKMIKSVTTSYGKITDAYYDHEEDMRHPGISYYTSLYLNGDIWGYWECDRHATPGTGTHDNRYFFTKGLNVDFKEDNEQFLKYKGSDNPDEDAFEGTLTMLTAENAKKCAEVQFSNDIV